MCKYCKFDNWIYPYNGRPLVCGAINNNNFYDAYIVAHRNGKFAIMNYYYNDGYFEINYCPYCGNKLVTPYAETFRIAEYECMEARTKKVRNAKGK